MNTTDRYPYFVYPAVERLKETTDPALAARLKKFIAANVGDRDALLALIGTADEDLRFFYGGAAPESLSTDDTIDSFIARFGSPAVVPPELEELSRLADPEPAEYTLEDAKELVKKRDYEGALAIMEEIYLNNPKKSVYFADQIRFIRKMMINESKK